MPPTTDLDYIHKFVPAPPGSSHPVTLLLLHGTGGDENALLSLGKELWPGAALLGLRGKVLENGMPPSFRRFTEVGIGDVKSRTEELAQFIAASSERYEFSKKKTGGCWLFQRCNPRCQFDSVSPPLPRSCSSLPSYGAPGA
jgi:predicted esterase